MHYHGGPIEGILSFAVASVGDEGAALLQERLSRFVRDHPTFSIQLHVEEGGLIVSGDDEIELMQLREEVEVDYGAYMGEVRVSYKESLRRQAEAEAKYIRQAGGLGNYGHVVIRIEPMSAGSGFAFVNAIKGGVVPERFIRAIEQGVRGAMKGGVLAGYELVDVKATLFDGSYHELDSTELAFEIAGSIAVKKAARKAWPVLLEPVMGVRVTVSDEFVGIILSDINSRRGRVDSIEHTAAGQVIAAAVSLARVLFSSENGGLHTRWFLRDISLFRRQTGDGTMKPACL